MRPPTGHDAPHLRSLDIRQDEAQYPDPRDQGDHKPHGITGLLHLPLSSHDDDRHTPL